MNKGKLIVVSGPSGAGKGTVLAQLFSMRDDLHYSISATTRGMREGEVDGKDYFFLSKKEFEKGIEQERFLEYASFCDNYYGTPKDTVEKVRCEGKNVILEIETDGAMQIKNKCKDSILIFLMPPSFEELEKRLVNRNTENKETIEKRLRKAKEELKLSEKYDYIVVNDKAEDAAFKLNEIINKP